MIITLLLVALAFVTTTLFGYVAHWALHQKFFGRFHQSHMTHHLKLYPVSDFSSEKYRFAGKDSTIWFFLVAGAPLLILPVVLLLLGKIGLITTILVVAMAGGIGLLNNWFHDSFHIKDHFLNVFGWYRKLVELHFEHHVNMQKNFGIFFFAWDKLFKSYSEK